MTHLWLRAETRPHEARVGLTPDGAARLVASGTQVTVEDCPQRCIPTARYAAAGCAIAPQFSWTDAPDHAVIFGLKDLPDDGTALRHRHIMFGHAFKDQPQGRKLLDRFRAGGGTLLDLEYLTDPSGRRVAAFGYWAGYVGAAVALQCWLAQQHGQIAGPVSTYSDAETLRATCATGLAGAKPSILIIGALGRVGTGAGDLCAALGLPVTRWDMPQTAGGGPFPAILQNDIFLNCILANPGCPVFVPQSARTPPRKLSVIGDIACDPDSDFSPIKVYDSVTSWTAPARRVHDHPPLDVTAIDNLPSLLPKESSFDFAAQLLPHLLTLDTDGRVHGGTLGDGGGIWERAARRFMAHV